MGTLPSQFLLLRDLPAGTTPQQIVTALIKLEGVRLRRLLLVEGGEDEQVPIAFAELQDSDAASRVLALAASLPGKGFSINRKPVVLSFIHPGVFVPVYGAVGPGIFKATNSTQLLAYWNKEYLCSSFIPENAIPEDEEDVPGNKKRKDGEKSSSGKRKALGSGVTIKSGSGGMIGHWSRRQEELNGTREEPLNSNVSTNAAAAKSTSFADLKIMACLLCSRKFKSEADLQAHETQSALHRENLNNPALLQKAQDRLLARRPQSGNTSAGKNDEDNDKAEGAMDDKADFGAIEYRDRALERRAQLKAAGETIEMPTSRKRRRFNQDGHSQHDDDSINKNDVDAGQKGPSKGAQLLSRMGYVAGSGTGLGINGQGRADPVQQETYLPGVGLGVAGAKLSEEEAAKRRGTGQGTYKDFVESVKEHARARYEREF